MRIRPAQREDGDEMRRCSMQICPLETNTIDHFVNILSECPGLSYVLVDDKDRIVGLSLVRIKDDPTYATHAHVSALALLPEYQGKRLGRDLLMNSLQSARVIFNVSEVTLNVKKSNECAIRLYTSLGFYTIREKPKFYHDGEGALAMNLVLADEIATTL